MDPHRGSACGMDRIFRVRQDSGEGSQREGGYCDGYFCIDRLYFRIIFRQCGIENTYEMMGSRDVLKHPGDFYIQDKYNAIKNGSAIKQPRFDLYVFYGYRIITL